MSGIVRKKEPGQAWESLPDTGGGGSQAALFEEPGEVPPLGAVTPTGVGYLYQDTENGALWLAVGATNSDWVIVAGNDPSETGAGVVSNLNVAALVGGGGGGVVNTFPGGNVQLIAQGEAAILLEVGNGNDAFKVFVDENQDAYVGFFQANTLGAAAVFQQIVGELSAVADPAAKAVLESLIGALVAYGQIGDATT